MSIMCSIYWILLVFLFGEGGAGDGETNENNCPSQNQTWHLPIGNMIFLVDFWCQVNFWGGHKRLRHLVLSGTGIFAYQFTTKIKHSSR